MINVRNDGEIADMFHGLARKIHEWVGLSVAVPRAAAKYIRSAGIMSQVVALHLCSEPEGNAAHLPISAGYPEFS